MGKTSIRGSVVNEVIIGAAIIIFVLFPVFSAVAERYIINIKGQIIKDAVDITNISTYTSIDSGYLGRSRVIHKQAEVEAVYSKLLACNLNLNEDLYPENNSIAAGKVSIESIIIYSGEHPANCPLGTEIVRPAVHSLIMVPVRPSLYRQIILNIMGRDYIELKVHVDSDIPVNN